MHVLIIGAAGMVGRKLTSALVKSGTLANKPIGRLTLADVVAPEAPAFSGKVETRVADLPAPGVADALVAERPDVIFHLAAAIARAGRMNAILAHHICDWLVPTTDLLLDRGMMGDGVIDLKGVRAMIEAAGYHGPQEIEIFSRDNWWKRPGDETIHTCVERFATVC